MSLKQILRYLCLLFISGTISMCIFLTIAIENLSYEHEFDENGQRLYKNMTEVPGSQPCHIETEHARAHARKLAYGFFAVTRAHLIAAFVNIRRLKMSRSVSVERKRNVDFLVLSNIELPNNIIISPDITLVRYKKVPSQRGYYKESTVKLMFFNMTDYYRIVYMDIDALVLRHMDELFDLPSSVQLASPVAYWEDELCFTAALLVIMPSNDIWTQLYEGMADMVRRGKADMDLINEFYDRRITKSFKIYPDILLLPGYFLILSVHLRERNQNYYQVPLPIFKDIDTLVNKTHIVHFSGQQKPWDLPRHSVMAYKSISKYFYDFNLQFKDEFEAVDRFLLHNEKTYSISLYELFDNY